MAAFNAVGEMATRGVGLTLLNYHCELDETNLDYDKNNVLYDSMGVWIVGKFDIERTRVVSAAEHIFWGAAHPREVTTKKRVCGYQDHSYKHAPPLPQLVDVDGLNAALSELKQTFHTYEAGDEECKAAFGVAPWSRVQMPRWLVTHLAPSPDKRPSMLYFLEDDTKHGRLPIVLDDIARTWLRKAPAATPQMPKTDDFEPLPPCLEIVAKAIQWDPFGARWGRGAHWPLIFGIGRARYRSPQMRQKRAHKIIAKKGKVKDKRKGAGQSTGCVGGSRGSWQSYRPKWWGVADGERQTSWGRGGWWNTSSWTSAETWDSRTEAASSWHDAARPPPPPARELGTPPAEPAPPTDLTPRTAEVAAHARQELAQARQELGLVRENTADIARALIRRQRFRNEAE